MTFDELLAQVVELLQRQGRVSYGALKRRFALADDYLQDLKDELIDAQRVAIDEDGKVLVWVGGETEGEKAKGAKGEKEKDFGPRTSDSGLTSGERRQLTVMFCDLVGSTALSTQLDPEELREVIQAYRATCATVITRFGGHLAKYIGDGLLMYFSYPLAHEDDAQRALRAGLEIVAAFQPSLSAGHEVPSPLVGEGQGEGAGITASAVSTPHPNLPPQGGKEKTRLTRQLQVRIGIHTGLVVAGEMGVGDQPEPLAIVGETPNLAARLQQEIAQPNTVVISAATYHLIQGYFECADLGLREVKGVLAPLQVYRVLGESGIQSRLEVAVSRGLTPLVGREQEVRLLLECWEQVKEGRGQVVLLSGEAGIGKSRLVRVLRERIAGEAPVWLECRCSPYHQNSALYPIIDLVQRVLGFTRDDSPEEKLTKLESASQVGARRAVPLQPDIVPLFASLLSLPLPERYPPLNLTPQRQKQKTMEALLMWLLAEAERQPVPFIVEDPHWADPSTLEFLGLLIGQVPTARLLTILAFRPEFTPPWPPRSHLTHLTLHRLPRKQVREMVSLVIAQNSHPSTSSGRTESESGGETFPVRAEPVEARTLLPDDLVDAVVARTDGVPLFVEELTKMVLEAMRGQVTGDRLQGQGIVGATHASPVPPLGIPATLHDALMARLDRLGPTKEVAQLGATLGREFNYELLRSVSPLDEAALQQGLRQLVEAELFYQHGLPPQATYLFKHALIQDAAYQSLLKSTRQQYHQQIAQVLEEKFSETKETHPELVAHHYTEAGLIAQAIPYWHKAGEKAIERSAYMEAIGQLSKGIELLDALPDAPDRTPQRLSLQLDLGNVLMATRGYAAPEVERALVRTRELCRQIGEAPLLFRALPPLRGFHFVRGELHAAQALAEQLLTSAQRMQFPPLLVHAHYGLGETLLFSGEFVSARTCLEQGLAHYGLQQMRAFAVLTVHDPGVACLTHIATALWYLGYPDQALSRIQEAVTLAQELHHSFSLAWALNYTAFYYQLCRDGKLAQEWAEALITLANEQGFPYWVTRGKTVWGWALAEQGGGKEGIAQIHQGLAAWQSTGTELWRTYLYALLADAYEKVGQPEEGLTALAEALAAIEKSKAGMWEAALYRLKGQLTLQQFQVSSSKFQVQESPRSEVRSQRQKNVF